MLQVLLIDDDEFTLTLMRTILLEAGYEVLSTADGPHGIEIFKQRRPDLVLLDLGLPSISGLEVLREIRGFDPQARVVVVTGYGSAQSAETAMGLGALDYMSKPLDPKLFLQKLKEITGDPGHRQDEV
jgi:CheY-like chemotaxis protein